MPVYSVLDVLIKLNKSCQPSADVELTLLDYVLRTFERFVRSWHNDLRQIPPTSDYFKIRLLISNLAEVFRSMAMNNVRKCVIVILSIRHGCGAKLYYYYESGSQRLYSTISHLVTLHCFRLSTEASGVFDVRCYSF